jgi:hypothetical protein
LGHDATSMGNWIQMLWRNIRFQSLTDKPYTPEKENSHHVSLTSLEHSLDFYKLLYWWYKLRLSDKFNFDLRKFKNPHLYITLKFMLSC